MASAVGQIVIPADEEVQWTQLGIKTYSAMSRETRTFWHTFQWADKTWIANEHGEALRHKDFPFIRIRTLAELHLQHTGQGKFTFKDPTTTAKRRSRHKQERLAKWLRIIIASGAWMRHDPVSTLNTQVYSISHHPIFSIYEWTITASNIKGELHLVLF